MWILKDHWRSMFGTAANPFMLDDLTKKENDLYLNENQMRQRYRMHNAYVMATVPKERLLTFSVSFGYFTSANSFSNKVTRRLNAC